jgi:signal transduction histidine kinase
VSCHRASTQPNSPRAAFRRRSRRSGRSAIRVDLDVSFEDRLPDQVEMGAYYTASEALTNASKHSDAKRVWVSLDVVDDVLGKREEGSAPVELGGLFS